MKMIGKILQSKMQSVIEPSTSPEPSRTIEYSANTSNISYKRYDDDAGVELFQDYPAPLLHFATACCILYILIGIPGNLGTIIALYKCKKVRNATAVFIMNLSVSDLMFCCFNLPLAASTFYSRAWRHGDLLCQLFPLLRYGLLAVSLFTVLSITINRYVMIGHPTLYPKLYRKEYLFLMVACTWVCGFGALVATWLGVFGRFGLDHVIGSCTILPDKHGRSPKAFLFTVAFVIPCISIVVCYARIFYIVRKTALKSRASTSRTSAKKMSKVSSSDPSSSTTIQRFLKRSKNTSTCEDSAIGTSTTGATISTDRSSVCIDVHFKCDRSPIYEIRQNNLNLNNKLEPLVENGLNIEREKFVILNYQNGCKTKKSDSLTILEHKPIPNSSFLHRTFSDSRINQKSPQKKFKITFKHEIPGYEPYISSNPESPTKTNHFLTVPVTDSAIASSQTTPSSSYEHLPGKKRKNRMPSVALSHMTSVFRRGSHSPRRQNSMNTVPGKMTAKDKKLLKMILVIFLSFITCYLPITISKTFHGVLDFHVLNIAGYVLIYLTTCINPIIYVVMSSEYRQAYKNLLMCKTSDQHNRSGSKN